MFQRTRIPAFAIAFVMGRISFNSVYISCFFNSFLVSVFAKLHDRNTVLHDEIAVLHDRNDDLHDRNDVLHAVVVELHFRNDI